MEQPRVISVSQVNAYLACPLKYRFQYVDKIPRPWRVAGASAEPPCSGRPDIAGGFIRRVGPNGIVTTYAGGGATTMGTSPQRATDVRLSTPRDMVVDATGALYYVLSGSGTEGSRVRRVSPDGILSIFAEGGTDFGPQGIALAPDGSLYITSSTGVTSGAEARRVWRVDQDGGLAQIAGTHLSPLENGNGQETDGTPAGQAYLGFPTRIAVADNGDYYYLRDQTPSVIQKISRSLAMRIGNEYRIPSPDGTEMHYFDLAGRHLRTRDAVTGALFESFRYDPDGQLAAIYDVMGDSTTVTRISGVAQGIVGPYGHGTGQTTTLGMSSGFLQTVTNPNNEVYQLTTHTDASQLGLLSEFQDPLTHASTFDWDSDGRLSLDEDAAGGSQSLPTPTFAGTTRTNVRETALGRKTTYRVTNGFSGTQIRVVTDPADLVTTVTDSSDARHTIILPNGMQVVDSSKFEPRFGMVAPIVGRVREMLPTSGRTRVTEVSRPSPYGPSYDPLTASGTFVEEVTLNGGPGQRLEFNNATDSLTLNSAAGRTVRLALHANGLVRSIRIPGLDSVTFVYDSHGRPSRVEQGPRGWRFSYDAKGRELTSRGV